jgi:hypothetical protein
MFDHDQANLDLRLFYYVFDNTRLALRAFSGAAQPFRLEIRAVFSTPSPGSTELPPSVSASARLPSLQTVYRHEIPGTDIVLVVLAASTNRDLLCDLKRAIETRIGSLLARPGNGDQ